MGFKRTKNRAHRLIDYFTSPLLRKKRIQNSVLVIDELLHALIEGDKYATQHMKDFIKYDVPHFVKVFIDIIIFGEG